MFSTHPCLPFFQFGLASSLLTLWQKNIRDYWSSNNSNIRDSY
ncbi:hypothetical protein T09_5632 [Trichinella sp. T9]|nr:hypothetical protein T09_5632 [Trichinella sp. T9]